jgi:hypothetical protein
MFFCVYKITNHINQKVYIGAHKTKDLNDDYFGSGVGLKRALRKHGKENFSKEILEVFSSEKEMYNREKELVFLGEQSYNMTRGGKGGFSHIDNFGDKNPMRMTEETRKKVSEAQKVIRNDPNKKHFYDDISRSNIKKAISNNTGRKKPEHSEFIKSWSTEMWSKNKDKMRDALSSSFEVVSPEGNRYVTNRLEDFCKERALPYTTIWRISISNKMPIKGKAKGWFCKRI